MMYLFTTLILGLCSSQVLSAREPRLVVPHRGCYLWSETVHDLEGDLFKLSDVNPMLCTYVAYAFAGIRANTLYVTENDAENLRICNMMRKVNPSLNIFLAVDAGNNQTDAEISSSLSSSKNRAVFVDSMAERLRMWNVDGLVLHAENLDYATANIVAILLKDIHSKFHEEAASSSHPRLALVVNVGNAAKMSRLDPQLIASVSDIVQVRGFDYHTPNYEPTLTGHNAPLYVYRSATFGQVASQSAGNIENTFHEWETFGIPKQKLVLTIALYGQAWQLAGKLRYEAGAPADGLATMRGRYISTPGRLSFHDICERLTSGNLTRVFDSDAMAPYAHDNESRTWVSYDDLESVKIKSRWILEKNYSGVVFWELSLEDFNGTCGELPLTLLKGASDVFSNRDKIVFDEKRVCDRTFCLKRGTGVFALGGCNTTYCNCDYGGNAYTFPCGPGTVFDPLILGCNYAQNIKSCEGLDSKHHGRR